MFNSNSDTYRFVKQNMMLQKNADWDFNGDNGKGDALWRTAVSYIAYGSNTLKDGILQCFRKFTMINKKKYWYQGSRAFDRYREDDVSRDQTILALSALKVRGDDEELKEIGKHLPYKLSRRFSMGPGMWFWIKAITTNKSSWHYVYQFVEALSFVPSVWLTKAIRLLLGLRKEYSQEWYMSVDHSIGFWSVDGKWVVNDDWYWVNNGQRLYSNHQHKTKKNFIYRFLQNLIYPDYALHLTSWMLYTSKDSLIKRILQKHAVWLTEKDNLLIRKLNGKKLDPSNISKYKPMNGFRWSSRLNKTSYFRYLDGDDATYNAIDKDILTFDQPTDYAKIN